MIQPQCGAHGVMAKWLLLTDINTVQISVAFGVTLQLL